MFKYHGASFNLAQDDGASVGLIAQEVEKIYPELETAAIKR